MIGPVAGWDKPAPAGRVVLLALNLSDENATAPDRKTEQSTRRNDGDIAAIRRSASQTMVNRWPGIGM
jgi:hypothetical protein